MNRRLLSCVVLSSFSLLPLGCEKKAEAASEASPPAEATAEAITPTNSTPTATPSTNEATAWETLQNEAAKLTDDLPTNEEEGRKVVISRLTKQHGDFTKFLETYPQSTNRWEARMTTFQIEASVEMLEGNTNTDLAKHRSDLRSIADDPEAPQNIRADAGLVLLQIASMEFDEHRTEQAARELSTAINKFLETHPDDARAAALRLTEAQALEQFDLPRAKTLYEEAAKNDDPEVADAAKAALDLMDFRNKPLELTFTAVDGQKVDLAKLRGKVVLLDFWATWCPPCVEEAPNVVAAYNKFKDQGFEIIGISLDKTKSALTKFTEENKMPWPQFFDGQGWGNEFAKRFNIQAVPTMWLLDREGKLIDPSPRGRLEQAIEAALAEKK